MEKLKGILKSERVALNFLSLISGVATTTKKFVDKVKGKILQNLLHQKNFTKFKINTKIWS